MKILITGASGFIGGRLLDLLSLQGEAVGTYNEHQLDGLGHLDITDAQQTKKFIEGVRPDIVVHTVALTDPDICQRHNNEAYAINYLGTKNVVSACRKTGSRLFYISTVYVFDGKKGNYSETDETNPINWYGKTKRAAEQEVQTLPDHTIFRFDIVYGYNGEGRANGVMDKVLSGTRTEINFDQVRQPLFVDDIAGMILLSTEKNEGGVFHLAGPDRVSKFELVKKLEQIIRPEKESMLIPIPEREQIARRPENVSITADRARVLGMRFTPIEEAMRKIEGQYLQSIEGNISEPERKS